MTIDLIARIDRIEKKVDIVLRKLNSKNTPEQKAFRVRFEELFKKENKKETL